MEGSLNLTGHILVTQPKGVDPFFSKGVVLVARHDQDGAWGLMINKPNKITLDQIMYSTGIEYFRRDRVYTGGPVDPHRIHVVHSLDWRSQTTIEITEDIGITNDVSVMAAIAADRGPALFRTCLGVTFWSPGQLDGEYKGNPPWKPHDRWLDAPATLEALFNLNGDTQWERCIEIVAETKIKDWF